MFPICNIAGKAINFSGHE
nr:hypothetical protein [Wolbachia endosymbiont of Atemnus politus]